MMRTICAILLTGLVLATTMAPALAAERVRLGTPVKANPTYDLPILVAEERGFWRAAGLEVKWTPFGSGTAMMSGLAAGAIDMGMSATVLLLPSIARGTPATLVADMGMPYTFSVYVRTDAGIRKPADLKGTTVGVTRLGSATHAYARVVAKGLGLEKEVKIVALGGEGPMRAALKAGVVDAVLDQIFSAIPLEDRGEVRELTSVRPYLPRQLVEVAIFAHNDFLKRHPAIVKRTMNSIFQSVDFIRKNPEWTTEKLRSSFAYSDKSALRAYQDLTSGKQGKINREGLENVLNFLLGYGILPRDGSPALDAIYTNELVD